MSGNGSDYLALMTKTVERERSGEGRRAGTEHAKSSAHWLMLKPISSIQCDFYFSHNHFDNMLVEYHEIDRFRLLIIMQISRLFS